MKNQIIEVGEVQGEEMNEYAVKFKARFLAPTADFPKSAVDFGMAKTPKNPLKLYYYEPVKFRGADKGNKIAACISLLVRLLVLVDGSTEARKKLDVVIPFALKQGHDLGVKINNETTL